MLPLLLTILPVLVVAWEGARFDRISERRERDAIEKSIDPIAARLEKMTAPSYWPGEMARRLRRQLRRPATMELMHRAGPAAALAQARRHIDLDGMPPVKMWAVSIKSPDPLAVELLRGHGLQTAKTVIFRGLLGEICRAGLRGTNQLTGDTWTRRLQSLFGPAFTGAFFDTSFRGRPIPVRTHDGLGFIVWDFISEGPIVSGRHESSRIAGAWLFFFPAGMTDLRRSLANTLLNWSRANAYPAFVEFPTQFERTRPRLLLHPAVHEGAPIHFLCDLFERMRPRPPASDTLAIDAVGRTWLPVALEGRVLHHGDWWFRVCRIDREVATLGVLMGRRDAARTGSARRIALALALAVGLGWGYVIYRGLACGRWPDLTIDRALSLWFLALALVPAVLSLFAAATIVLNREQHLTDTLAQEMTAATTEIDTDGSRLDIDKDAEFRRYFSDKSLGETLLRLHVSKDRAGLAAFKQQLLKQCRAMDLHMQSLTICGFRGFLSFSGKFAVAPALVQAWLQLLRDEVTRTLGSEPPFVTQALDQAGLVPATAAADIGLDRSMVGLGCHRVHRLQLEQTIGHQQGCPLDGFGQCHRRPVFSHPPKPGRPCPHETHVGAVLRCRSRHPHRLVQLVPEPFLS